MHGKSPIQVNIDMFCGEIFLLGNQSTVAEMIDEASGLLNQELIGGMGPTYGSTQHCNCKEFCMESNITDSCLTIKDSID